MSMRGFAAQPGAVDEIAGAVLEPFDSDASFEAIGAPKRQRIAEFAREQRRLRDQL